MYVLYMYIHVCLVSVCMKRLFTRSAENAYREREKRKKKRERVCVCACACVRAYVCVCVCDKNRFQLLYADPKLNVVHELLKTVSDNCSEAKKYLILLRLNSLKLTRSLYTYVYVEFMRVLLTDCHCRIRTYVDLRIRTSGRIASIESSRSNRSIFSPFESFTV